MVAPTQYIFLTGYFPTSADSEQLTNPGAVCISAAYYRVL